MRIQKLHVKRQCEFAAAGLTEAGAHLNGGVLGRENSAEMEVKINVWLELRI